MLVASTKADLQAYLEPLRSKGQSVGFVATMGALHPGHIALVRQAMEENDVACCSIFVNPTQFNNPEDLKHYPRTLENDLKLLREAGCHTVFTPEVEEMYPPGEDQSRYLVDLGLLNTVMEGEHRPGHFKGVALVVGKLLEMVVPDRAYFGVKDYQQVQVVRVLVKTMQLPVTVVGSPTFREADGLAMSSRNLRLTKEQRAAAPVLYETLQWAKSALSSQSILYVEAEAAKRINAHPEIELEYFVVADADTLEPTQQKPENGRLVACLSAFAGPVRLIDNLIVFP